MTIAQAWIKNAYDDNEPIIDRIDSLSRKKLMLAKEPKFTIPSFSF